MLDDGYQALFRNRFFRSNSELVGLCPGSWRCNSSTERFFPRHITTQGPTLHGRGWTLNFISADAKISYDTNLKDWSNYSLSWNRCKDSGILILTRK